MPTKILKALADPTRLKIVELLKQGEICACKLVPLTKKAQPTVSQHLKILENAGIVKSKKEGKMIFYSVVDPKIFDLIEIAKKVSK